MIPLRPVSLLFLICFIFSLAYGKDNFKPGFIVSLQGEIISGEVNYQNWFRNPVDIEFKDNRGEISSFSSLDISGFGVEGERYESAIIEVNDASSRTDNLKKSDSLYLRTDSAFILTLIEGPKSLFEYVDKQGVKHFIIKNDGQHLSLISQEFRVVSRWSTYMAKREYYKQELLAYLKDCMLISQKLEHVQYIRSSLIDIFKDYYSCKKVGTYYVIPKPKVSVSIGILGGVGIEKISFAGSSETLNAYIDADYSVAIVPQVGFFIEVPFARNFGKFSINAELLYTTSRFEQDYEEVLGESHRIETSSQIVNGGTKLTILLKHRFSLERERGLYVQAGVAGRYMHDYSQLETKRTIFFSSDRTIIDSEPYATRKLEPSFILGVGYQKGKFRVELRGELADDIAPQVNFSSVAKRAGLLIGYSFF